MVDKLAEIFLNYIKGLFIVNICGIMALFNLLFNFTEAGFSMIYYIKLINLIKFDEKFMRHFRLNKKIKFSY